MAARPIAMLLALVVVVSAVATSAVATQFRVGGQSGWSVPGAGSEPYNTWAGRLRFQIGDQLLFVYPKETDSVVQVADAAAYNACNTTSYVARFDDGSTVFTFNRSGPFFFVSGNDASCRANQKLIVVVLADRSGGARTPPAAPPPTSPAPMPSPLGSPPAATAPAPVPATSSPPPSSSGAAPVPAPMANPASPPSPPASAPAPAPTTTTPSSPPAPAAQTPSPSTTPTPGGPSTTPTPGGGSSPPPSASANVPAGGSTTPPPPSASAPVVASFVGSLGAFMGYAMLAA